MLKMISKMNEKIDKGHDRRVHVEKNSQHREKKHIVDKKVSQSKWRKLMLSQEGKDFK